MKPNKPRLLLVARNFPPVVGGIEQLMKSTFDVLCDDYDIVLLGPKGSSAYSLSAARTIELPSTTSLFLPLALLLAPFLALYYRPAVVVSANGLMSPIGWCIKLFSRARHIGFLHGLDVVSENGLYRSLFLPCIRRTQVNIVNSKNTCSLAIDSNIPFSSLVLIHPCIREPMEEGGDEDFESRMRDRGKYILYAGRVVPRKGLQEFLVASAQWIKDMDITLVVAGDTPTQNAGPSLATYASGVLSVIESHGLLDHMVLTGSLSDSQMASCFRHASVHVMPLVEVIGDVEGFGMVAVEAAGYGVPTVAFNCGGVADAIAFSDCLVAPADYPMLHEVLEKYYRGPSNKAALMEWARNFSTAQFSQKIRKVL